MDKIESQIGWDARVQGAQTAWASNDTIVKAIQTIWSHVDHASLDQTHFNSDDSVADAINKLAVFVNVAGFVKEGIFANVSNVTGALDAVRTSLDTRASALESRADGLENRTGLLEGRMTEAEKFAEELEKMVDALEGELDETKDGSYANKTKASLDDIVAKATKLRGDHDTLDN